MSTTQPWSGRALLFVGIGGAGMSGLALVARSLGATVTGSDRAAGSPYVGPLRALGVEPVAGHDAANVPERAEVVVSSAIPPENPERSIARERGQRELHRAELLGELTRLKPTIAISGTHGKTTTSSMVVHILRGCGLDPSYLVGGEVRSTGSNAGWGSGDLLVVEADESDRSLLKLSASIAILTNAELDHHATYSSQRDVDETFATFLEAANVVVLGDEPGLTRFPGVVARPADVVLEPGGSRFTVDGPGRARGRRLRASPDRGARHDRRGPHVAAAPRRRRLPAAPLQPHPAPVPRVRRGARHRRPGRGARRLSRPRARGGLSGRQRAARGRRDRRRGAG